jgi:hypothetical protein
VIGRFLGIAGWDPSVCKSNRLNVDILQFSFIKFGHILQIPLKWSVIFLQFWTSTGYFSNSTGSLVTNCRFSPVIDAPLCPPPFLAPRHAPGACPPPYTSHTRLMPVTITLQALSLVEQAEPVQSDAHMRAPPPFGQAEGDELHPRMDGGPLSAG